MTENYSKLQEITENCMKKHEKKMKHCKTMRIMCNKNSAKHQKTTENNRK